MWELANRIFLTLPQGFRTSKLPIEELHRDYAALGGIMDKLELEACVLELLDITPREHNIAALALNEFFLGEPNLHLVAYWDNPLPRRPNGSWN